VFLLFFAVRNTAKKITKTPKFFRLAEQLLGFPIPGKPKKRKQNTTCVVKSNQRGINMSSQPPSPTPILPTTSRISAANRWDHWLARWGINRNGHRVIPGLYALGNPNPRSPVFVTANYTLSFDALREALHDRDAYLLILDTEGVNVWCAAGKGSFGTKELVRRIELSGLAQIVEHRRLILPQLGAPGIAAHEVKRRSGFVVEYGPVQAEDLPEYLQTGQASPAMRRVRFPLKDRVVLIPVELVYVLFPWLLGAILLRSAALITAILSGAVLFPILMPWLPTPNFSSKGWVLGGITALPFVIQAFLTPASNLWLQIGGALSLATLLPPVTAFLALNFTGSTPFPSRTGVRREIFRYIPAMAWSFGVGILLWIVLLFFNSGVI
jgi:hypothetical protein